MTNACVLCWARRRRTNVRYSPQKRSQYNRLRPVSAGGRTVRVAREKKTYLYFFRFFFAAPVRRVARLFAFVGSICRSVGQMIDCRERCACPLYPAPSTPSRGATRHRNTTLRRDPRFDLHPDRARAEEFSKNRPANCFVSVKKKKNVAACCARSTTVFRKLKTYLCTYYP